MRWPYPVWSPIESPGLPCHLKMRVILINTAGADGCVLNRLSDPRAQLCGDFSLSPDFLCREKDLYPRFLALAVSQWPWPPGMLF